MKQWTGFKEGKWCSEINVSNFIKLNYKGYEGDESFLSSPTEKTHAVWDRCSELLKEELEKKVLDIDTTHMSGINAFKPGYIEVKRSPVLNPNIAFSCLKSIEFS